ncbi:MAG: hypothetical protein E6J91_24790 [Deltaproteobacteria bacterium]|nr:MAG: hypothetical protein E6J91_24790 [Deltaproteobacteria bacterium]
MAASLTRLCTSGPRSFALAAASLAIIVVAQWMSGSATPRAMHGGSITATITEVVEEPFHCGIGASFGQVRYGDQLGVVVPCMEFDRGKGLRFAVGDTHTVSFDEHDRVVAITWKGETWRFTSTHTWRGKTCHFSSSVVLTPADAIGHISGGTGLAGQWGYEAPNWRWSRTDPELSEVCMDEFLSLMGLPAAQAGRSSQAHP